MDWPLVHFLGVRRAWLILGVRVGGALDASGWGNTFKGNIVGVLRVESVCASMLEYGSMVTSESDV